MAEDDEDLDGDKDGLNVIEEESHSIDQDHINTT